MCLRPGEGLLPHVCLGYKDLLIIYKSRLRIEIGLQIAKPGIELVPIQSSMIPSNLGIEIVDYNLKDY
jgi:hypothetical protein